MLNRILKGRGNHIADIYVAFKAICMTKSIWCGHFLFLFKLSSNEGKNLIRNAHFWCLESSSANLYTIFSVSTLFLLRHQQALLLLVKTIGKDCLCTKLCFLYRTKKYNLKFPTSEPEREVLSVPELINVSFLSLLLSLVIVGKSFW